MKKITESNLWKENHYISISSFLVKLIPIVKIKKSERKYLT